MLRQRFRYYATIILLFSMTAFLLIEYFFPSSLYKLDDTRKNADAVYNVKKECPADLERFNYCRSHGLDSNFAKLLLIGDSMGLAVSEFLEVANIEHIYLGAGSCPILKGLVLDYAEHGCSNLTERFYSELINTLVDDYQIDSIVMVHSAGYLDDVSIDEYRGSLLASVSGINRDIEHGFGSVYILEPVPRPTQNISHCLPRLGMSERSCEVGMRSNQIQQQSVINAISQLEHLQLKVVRPDIGLPTPHLLEYKDELHLSVLGAQSFYGAALSSILSREK